MTQRAISSLSQQLSCYTPNASQLMGLVVIFLASIACLWLSQLPVFAELGISAMTLAILLGIFFGNTLYPTYQQPLHAGVCFAKGQLLRIAIVLYGFKLSLAQIAAVGLPAIATDLIMLTATFSLAYLIGTRWLNLDKHTVILIGAGSSICGAAQSSPQSLSSNLKHPPNPIKSPSRLLPWSYLVQPPCCCIRCCFN